MVEGVSLRILPLRRIVDSKRAAGRPRDVAQIPALEEALAALEGEDPKPRQSVCFPAGRSKGRESLSKTPDLFDDRRLGYWQNPRPVPGSNVQWLLWQK